MYLCKNFSTLFKKILFNSMPSKPQISIIVPVYNMEHYLRQCLDSISSQTFENWECILVDDGSKDSSGDICEDYAKRDARFRVVHRENGGLSAARNTGMRHAKGIYTGFIDSDDWVEPTYLQTLYDLITSTGCDMVQIGFIDEYKGFSKNRNLVKTPARINRKELASKLVRGSEVPNYVWNKLFRSELIGPDFPEGISFEDIYIFNIWLGKIQSAFLSTEPLYHYRRRKGSIMNSRYSASRIDYLNGLIQRKKVMQALEPEAISDSEALALIWNAAIDSAKTIARYESDADQRKTSLLQISRLVKDFPKPTRKALSLKRLFRGKMLRDNPSFFCDLMRLVIKTDFQTNHRNKALYD